MRNRILTVMMIPRKPSHQMKMDLKLRAKKMSLIMRTKSMKMM